MSKFLHRSIALLLIAIITCCVFSACNGTSPKRSTTNTSQDDDGLSSSMPDNNASDSEKDEEYISEDEKLGNMDEGMLGSNGAIVTKDYDGYLGYGYNMITAAYYNPKDINDAHPVVDMASLVTTGKVYVNNTSANFADPRTYVYQSTKEYAEAMSARAGVRGKFPLSGSFKVNFNIDTSYQMKSNQRLVTLQANLETRKDYISGCSAELIAQHLTEEFKNDVKKLSSDPTDITIAEFVTKYGTHVLTNVTMGGRFDLNYLYTSKSTSETADIETSLKASYKYISGDTDTSNKEKKKEIEENSILQIRTYGGSVTVDPSSIEKAISSYKEWSTGVQEGLTTFIGASEVIPIWDIIEELYDLQEGEEKNQYAGKSNAVKTYCINTADTVSNSFKDTVGSPKTYISDIYIGTGSTKHEARNMLYNKGVLDENIVSIDLNKGAGGKWIYLGFKLTTEKSKAITYLAADYYGKKQTTDIKYNGWNMTIIPVDLNAGARGKYIYLYYTKDPNASEPITEIQYQENEEFEHGNANGYRAVQCIDDGEPMDFNRGAGGSFIYLWYK